MTNKVFSKVAAKAAQVIQVDGLCKGEFGTDDGPKCALGALRFARWGTTTKNLGLTWEQMDAYFKAARPRSRRMGIEAFNDADRTRRHDVVKLLQDISRIAAR